MNVSDVNRQFDLLSLASGDTQLRRAGAYHVGPCPFCGGTDRFSLKTTPHGYRWYCRKCGDGKYRTAIDYMMRRDGLNFVTALARAGGDPEPSRGGSRAERRSADRSRSVEVPDDRALPDSAWQAAAWREVDAAAKALSGPEGGLARQYLLGRGLQRGTWLAWQLGVAEVYDPLAGTKRPAIILPWFDMTVEADVITAVKYRFIEEEAKGLRYTSRRGSVASLYGLWAAAPQNYTLLLVEGEINALSVWQCAPEGVTCLSFGSEAGGKPEVLIAAARNYRRVFVWADDPKRSLAIRAALGRQAVPLQSPRREGVKLDANEMLKKWVLEEFLRRAMR